MPIPYVSPRESDSRDPWLVDLFCGAGGASVGYHEAGFNVIGVDISPQPHYPFDFIQADALCQRTFDYLINYADAVHASPPCQRYSSLSKCRPGLAERYPDLIGPTRDMLDALGVPYVIENVPDAPLINAVTLCGGQFGREAFWPLHGRVGLRRHRLFEAHGFTIPDAGPHDHSLRSVACYGHGNPGNGVLYGKGHAQAQRDVMGIEWMTRDELAESIPPAYTRHVGKALADQLVMNKAWYRSALNNAANARAA